MTKIDKIKVLYHGMTVGTLAYYKGYQTAFQYDKEWLVHGFSISPISLSLQNKLFIAKYEPFAGQWGVFADSLPDGWGRLLVDRMLVKNNMIPAKVTSLERLAIVGSSGMGALTYEPEFKMEQKTNNMDLDSLAAACKEILTTEHNVNLDELFRLGGSSGGARPKILTTIDGEDWIVKFPSSVDSANIGKQEYDYAQCAKKCGIEMAESRILPSKKCDGYFATRRFDRMGNERLHMVSVAGLLETSHRIPNLDYNTLMKLTYYITKSELELKKLYKLMCFNIFAHNRDDHSRNFSFLYMQKENRWILSPAYDLTYSNSFGGEHATMVNGNGKNPNMKDLLAVAQKAALSKNWAQNTAMEIQEIVQENLTKYIEK